MDRASLRYHLDLFSIINPSTYIRCFSDAVESEVGKGIDFVITLSLTQNSELRNET